MNPYYTSILVNRAIGEREDLKLVGVTGGMGSGKTTFCNNFISYCTTHGKKVSHIDLDYLVKTLYTNEDSLSQSVLSNIKGYFGDFVFNQGKLDKRKLAEIIFSNPESREKLAEILTLPLAIRYTQSLETKTGLTLVESAYFTEYNLMSLVNFNFIFVSCNEQERLERISQRDKLTTEEIRARLSSQHNSSEKKRLTLEAQTQINLFKRFFCEVNTSETVDYQNILKRLEDYFRI